MSIDYRILEPTLAYPGQPDFVKLNFTLEIGETENGVYNAIVALFNAQLNEYSGELYIAEAQKPRLVKAATPGMYTVATVETTNKQKYDKTFSFVYEDGADKPRLTKFSFAQKARIAALATAIYNELAAVSGGVGVTETVTTTPVAATADKPACPTCGGDMFDNTTENAGRAQRGEKIRPEYKCKTRECTGIIWAPKGKYSTVAKVAPVAVSVGATETEGAEVGLPGEVVDDLPF